MVLPEFRESGHQPELRVAELFCRGGAQGASNPRKIPIFALDTSAGFGYSAISVFTGGSSSGRTTGSEPVYGGSNPPPPTNTISPEL
jgi:hypothetical protein